MRISWMSNIASLRYIGAKGGQSGLHHLRYCSVRANSRFNYRGEYKNVQLIACVMFQGRGVRRLLTKWKDRSCWSCCAKRSVRSGPLRMSRTVMVELRRSRYCATAGCDTDIVMLALSLSIEGAAIIT